MKDNARQHRRHRMHFELEGCDDPKVATSSTYRPKEIVVLASAGGDKAAVRKYDFGGEQVIECEAVFAHEPAEPPAKGKARNTGDRDEATGGGEAVRLKRVVHLAPVAAASTRTVRAGASIVMAFIPDRSITKPSSHTGKAGDVVAVPRIETSRFSWRAKFTASITSPQLAHRAMSAGRRSMVTLNTARAASYRWSPGDDQLAAKSGFKLVDGRGSDHHGPSLYSMGDRFQDTLCSLPARANRRSQGGTEAVKEEIEGDSGVILVYFNCCETDDLPARMSYWACQSRE